MADSCNKCGVTGVKLWREVHAYSHAPELLCVVHACESKEISPDEVDERGARPRGDGLTTDQIGWYVPAVRADDDSWWGYTSIPQDAYDAWAALPTRASVQ
jgi:hypothetical protein